MVVRMSATLLIPLVAMLIIGFLVAWVTSLTWEVHDLELSLAHEQRKVSTLKAERDSLRRSLEVRRGTRY